MGWGLLGRGAHDWQLAGCGVLRARAREPLAQRLERLYAGLLELLDRLRPQEAAVEDLFHARNARSALILGHARGVILLALRQRGLCPASYAARTIKQAITGSGSADKDQVRHWVCRWLGASPEGVELDASDALAVALCHVRSRGWRALMEPPSRRRRRRSACR